MAYLALHGWDLQGSSYSTVSGCESDGNNQGNSGGGMGMNINGATNCSITGNCGGNQPGIEHPYGFQLASNMSGTYIIGNSLTGSTGQVNNLTGSGGYVAPVWTGNSGGI